jgi:DHA1 family bicyclomycin/chloramphenicol resistance-like MFS transporter
LAAFACVSIFSGKITDRLGVYNTIWVSLGFIALASTMMLFSHSAYAFTLSNIVSCFGSALLYPIIFARSLEIFPDIRGSASSAIISLRYLLCAGITGIASYLYDGNPFTLAAIIFVVMSIVIGLTFVLLKKMQWGQGDKIYNLGVAE